MKTHTEKTTIAFCRIDRIYSIYHNGETIHTQPTKPNETEIIEALTSDNWKERFKDMREGKTVRISDRIYFDILSCVPPIKHTGNSFFCGEPYSGNLHHFFYKDSDGKRYGKLKKINK